jgi:hypothetical protein
MHNTGKYQRPPDPAIKSVLADLTKMIKDFLFIERGYPDEKRQ